MGYAQMNLRRAWASTAGPIKSRFEEIENLVEVISKVKAKNFFRKSTIRRSAIFLPSACRRFGTDYLSRVLAFGARYLQGSA